MRKREIRLGAAYAVGCSSPVEARVLAPGSEAGEWSVRFARPVVSAGWGGFREVRADERSSSPSFLEATVESRQIIAPWDRFVAEELARKAREQSERERLQAERAEVHGALERLEAALRERGFAFEPPGCSTREEYVHVPDSPGGPARASLHGRIQATAEILDYLAAAVEGAPRPAQESALAELLGLTS